MNKKIIKLCFVLALCVSTLFGCAKKEDTMEVSDDRLQIVSTIFAPYDFAKQIVGDKAEVTMLLSPGAESHSYEPTPQDIIKIEKCDVFIYVGGENDEWVDNILSSIENKDMKVVKLLDLVDAVEEELKDGMQPEEEEEAADEEQSEEVEWDEHVWTSPKNAITISTALEETFASIDAENADYYKKNMDQYVDELTQLDQSFREVIDSAKRKVVVFGDRFPLRYFVEEYGLDYYAAFPGCSSDTEASAATIAFLVDKVKSESIPVVFKIELSNGNIANSIAEATGSKVLTFNACHNISKDDFESGITYLDMMQTNVTSLKEALN